MALRIAFISLLSAVATAFAADPGAATPKPAPSLSSGPTTHRITFKARIDAMALLVIQNGKMHLEAKGAPAENISVNSRKWNAVYTNSVSEDFTKFSPSLGPFDGKTVSAKLIKSRGSLNIREQPTPANGEKFVIELRDEAAGPSDFELVITW